MDKLKGELFFFFHKYNLPKIKNGCVPAEAWTANLPIFSSMLSQLS